MSANSSRHVVIVDAVRTPFGRKNGALSVLHPVSLLGTAQSALISRTGIDPQEVGQVVGGCVGQVGAQTMNVTRTAWLAAGLPLEVAATTVDSQCGSSQQASTLAYGMVASGVIDVAVACGVEVMSKVPMGSAVPKEPNVGKPVNRDYFKHHEVTTQFEAAERMAEQWEISRVDCDHFGQLSQQRAARAWSEDRFGTQIVPVTVPGVDGGSDTVVDRDEGLRDTTLEALAGLKPTGRPDGVHTAGSSSQIADGASALLLMTKDKANALGLQPMACIVDACLIGSDPALMLTGPIRATQHLLQRNQLELNDIDLVEINEAFASVVLAWQKELGADRDRTNPNGGAIALGHPLGATGVALIAKAVHELTRTSSERALVTMCCGGGLGTGTLLSRI
jgi:acetyl-CoA C-acetyltransferase